MPLLVSKKHILSTKINTQMLLLIIKAKSVDFSSNISKDVETQASDGPISGKRDLSDNRCNELGSCYWQRSDLGLPGHLKRRRSEVIG